jgi:exosortase/archaeosortase family protein
VSLQTRSIPSPIARLSIHLGNLRVPQSVLWALCITLVANIADYLFSPILYSSSPLWAVSFLVLLLYRQRSVPIETNQSVDIRGVSAGKLGLFLLAHTTLVLGARILPGALIAESGGFSARGWVLAGMKLLVLVPTVLLLPIATWRKFGRAYKAECIAALLMLTTFLPRRAMESVWPWYGQVLGHLVYGLAKIFVPTLGYQSALTPTLTGPDLDVTILYACSGINGVELFDYLFAFVVFLDWNRLNKKRTFIGYFAGVTAMLIGNTLRIASMVVVGNHGFAAQVERLHISAGWLFFSCIFLMYLAATYQWFLSRRVAALPEGI